MDVSPGDARGRGRWTRLVRVLGRHRGWLAMAGAVVAGAVAVTAVAVWGPANRGARPSTAPSTAPSSVPSTAPSSLPPPSTSTTSPPTPGRWPLHSTPALYPAWLPDGFGPGSLQVDTWSAPTFGGYVQSYYGPVPRGLSLPELVIAGPEAQQMFATSGKAPEPAVLAGQPVTIWRIVSAGQAGASGTSITGVAATVAGRQVSLLGVGLSDTELGEVLSGLQPRAGGVGWDTATLPASLVPVAEGTRSDDAAFIPYRVEFPGVTLRVTHDVLIPRGACVCNPGSWPVQLTTVDGTTAALIDVLPAQPGQEPGHEIEWQYSPDAVVSITYSGISTSQALQIAASVRTAPLSTWRSLACTKTVVGVGAVACDPQAEIPTVG